MDRKSEDLCYNYMCNWNKIISEIWMHNRSSGVTDDPQTLWVWESINPSDDFSEVFSHTNFSTYVNKQKDLPAILNQAVLERMHDFPMVAVKVFRGGCKNDNCTGSGIYVKSH